MENEKDSVSGIGINSTGGQDSADADTKKGQKRGKVIKGPLICGSDGCGYRTKRLSNMTRHRSTMHQKKDLECCGVSFRNKAKYKVHRLAVHSKGFQCLECTKIFSRKALLKRHSSVHSGIYDFQCAHPNCPYESSHKSNVQRHFMSQHPKEFAETGEAAIVRRQQRQKSQDDQIPIPIPSSSSQVKPKINEEKSKAENYPENVLHHSNVNWGQFSSESQPIYPNYYPRPFTIHYHSYPNYRQIPETPYPPYHQEPVLAPSFIDYNNNDCQSHHMAVPLTSAAEINPIATASPVAAPDDPFQNYVPKKWRVVKRRV